MCRRAWWALAVLATWAAALVVVHLHAANVGYVAWEPSQGRPEPPRPSAVQSQAATIEAIMRMACLPVSFAATLLVTRLSSETRAEWLFLRAVTVLALSACGASIVLGLVGLWELVFWT